MFTNFNFSILSVHVHSVESYKTPGEEKKREEPGGQGDGPGKEEGVGQAGTLAERCLGLVWTTHLDWLSAWAGWTGCTDE